jgi:arylformamidase
MTEYRAEFDADVTFLNGGGLQAQGFKLDVPDPGITEDELASLFVRHLGLLMTERVTLRAVRVVQEPHKGLRGHPEAPGWRRPARRCDWSSSATRSPRP